MKTKQEHYETAADALAEDGYVSDAVAMLGAGYASIEIEPPRRTMKRSGRGEFEEVENPAWIKFSTAFKNELPDIDGNALKVWIFIALSVNYKGDAFPGIQTIAKAIGLSHTTVISHIKSLEELGILSVRRGERRVNIYNVADDYVKIGHGEPVKKLESSDATSKENVPTSKENASNSKAGLNLTRINQNNKNDDELQTITEQANRKVDAILDMANAPGIKAEARRAAIQSYLGERLHVNTETKAWREFAKYVDGQQQAHGEKVEVFIGWLLGQDKFNIQYWPPRRMQEMWPQAFMKAESVSLEASGWK